MKRDPDKTTPFIKDEKKPSPRSAGSATAIPAAVVVSGGAGAAALSPAMFGNFEAAKKRKMPSWAMPLLISVFAAHAVALVGMWVKSIWEIEQLEKPKNSFDMAIAPPPPPPAAPPKGGAKPKDAPVVVRKVKVKDIVQPVKIEKQEAPAPVEQGDPNGVEGGAEGGVEGGDLNGVAQAPPPPPPPPPPAPPQNVVPTELDAHRISGEKNIVPDEVTKMEIQRSGKDRLIGTFKVCITPQGNVKTVNQLKSTAFPSYDTKILNTIRAEWRYAPFDTKAPLICSSVTFIYTQK